MRLIDADKLYPDCLTKSGTLAISQSQIANAPTVEVATNLQPNCNKLQGEWEDYSIDFYRCPECGYLLEKDCPCCHNKVILPKGGADS